MDIDPPEGETEREKHVRENTKEDGSEGPNLQSPQGLDPDPAQHDLRSDDRNPVFRTDADTTHQNLLAWADPTHGDTDDQGRSPLAQVLDRTARKHGTDDRVTFTQAELDKVLRNPNFSDLDQGQRGAVVAALARMSISFHEQHASTVETKDSDGETTGTVKPGPAIREKSQWPAEHRTGMMPNIKQAGQGLNLDQVNQNNAAKGVETHYKRPGIKALLDAAGDHRPDFTGKNFAVIEVKRADGSVEYIADSSIPAGQHGFAPGHSEKMLLDEVDRRNRSTNPADHVKVQSLYTEREPCGKGEGHANCSNRLRTHTAMQGVPVHYTTTYRSDPVGVDARQKVRDQWEPKIQAIRGDSSLTPKQKEAKIEAVRNERDKITEKMRTKLEVDVAKEFKGYMQGIGDAWVQVIPQLL